MRSSPQKATRSASDLAARGARMCCSWAFLKTTGFMCPKGGAGQSAPASRWDVGDKNGKPVARLFTASLFRFDRARSFSM